jgi:hypothetical protein
MGFAPLNPSYDYYDYYSWLSVKLDDGNSKAQQPSNQIRDPRSLGALLALLMSVMAVVVPA